MKHQKQVLPIEKKLKQTTRAALIPHAGYTFAGHARYAALRYFKKTTKRIIYLATLHKIEHTGKTYILHKDPGFRLGKHHFFPTDKKEHSFDWVHDELVDFFPSAKILALAPDGAPIAAEDLCYCGLDRTHHTGPFRDPHTPNVRHLFRRADSDVEQWITTYLKKHKDSILIATTDLIHYGEKFNNKDYLSYPHQMDKLIKEEKLINAMVNVNPPAVAAILRSDPQIADGPKTVEIFMKVMSDMNYKGKVTDYYDSYGSQKALLDRYVIQQEPINNLVSYVSIIYGDYTKVDDLLPIDILMGLGLVKSILMRDTLQKNYSLRLPIWSPLYQRKQGIFVGTALNHKTNCSYGQYENGLSTAEKIIKATENCANDASQRWKIPYDPQMINNLSYKIEFLDPQGKWSKPFLGSKIFKNFKADGRQGIYLTLKDGKAATYLPIVFRENPEWSIRKIMRNLTKKTGWRCDHCNQWKKGTIQTYKSKSYTWNPHTKMVDIFPPPIIKIKRNNRRSRYSKKRPDTKKRKKKKTRKKR